MEKKILDRRSVLSRLGGMGLASAFVLAKGGPVTFAQSAGEFSVLVKGMIAGGRWCGESFVANVGFTPDADGMIASGVFQLVEVSADLPFLAVGEEYTFVGTYKGRTFDLRVAVPDEDAQVNRYISFHGVTEHVAGSEPLDKDGNKVVEAAGSFSGPIGCELGSWTTTITDDSAWCDGCGCCEESATTTAAAPVVVPETTTTTTTEATTTTTTTDAGTTTTTTTDAGTTTTTTTTDAGTTTTTTTTTTTPDCGEHGTWNGQECVCDPTFEWIGDQCICPVGSVLINGACEVILECENGFPAISPDGLSQYCECYSGFEWNGTICACSGEIVVGESGSQECVACAANESYSATYGRCVCNNGYARNLNGICIVASSCAYGTQQGTGELICAPTPA